MARRPPVLSENLARNLLLLGELRGIASQLETAGISYIVLKGLPLAQRTTGHIDGRAHLTRDNDVLVRRADVARVIRLMQSIGYEPDPGLTLESQLRVNFEFELWKAVLGTFAVLEVHWAPFPAVLYPVDEDWLWTRTELVQLGNRAFPVLDRALTILQLASHFVQHHAKGEWILRDFAAAWNLWGDELDREDFVECCRRTGLFHAFSFTLGAAMAMQLVPSSQHAFRSSRARALSWLLSNAAARQLPEGVRAWEFLVLARPQHVAEWLWLRAAPPLEAVAAFRGRPTSALTYLEYLRRPFRALARALRRGR